MMFGKVELRNGGLYVTGTSDQTWEWAHRPGAAWPCSTLTSYEKVVAELDPDSGDLVDLNAWVLGEKYAEDSEDVELDGSELTAWIDDCLTGTPYASLRRARSSAEGSA